MEPITPMEIIHIIKTAITGESFTHIYSELIEAYNETSDDDHDKEILGSLIDLFTLLEIVVSTRSKDWRSFTY